MRPDERDMFIAAWVVTLLVGFWFAFPMLVRWWMG